MPNPPSVEAYLADLPDDRRRVVEDIRRTVIAAAPDAVETVAYEMPALRTSDGHFLVSYAAFKNHYSLFPASDFVVRKLGREVDPYVAGKGTFRFPPTGRCRSTWCGGSWSGSPSCRPGTERAWPGADRVSRGVRRPRRGSHAT